MQDDPAPDTYADCLSCVVFWRECAERAHGFGDDSYDVLRFISYEQEATCELIGFACDVDDWT